MPPKQDDEIVRSSCQARLKRVLAAQAFGNDDEDMDEDEGSSSADRSRSRSPPKTAKKCCKKRVILRSRSRSRSEEEQKKGGLAFLSKKSWHSSSIANVEKVWNKEQGDKAY